MRWISYADNNINLRVIGEAQARKLVFFHTDGFIDERYHEGLRKVAFEEVDGYWVRQVGSALVSDLVSLFEGGQLIETPPEDIFLTGSFPPQLQIASVEARQASIFDANNPNEGKYYSEVVELRDLSLKIIEAAEKNPVPGKDIEKIFAEEMHASLELTLSSGEDLNSEELPIENARKVLDAKLSAVLDRSQKDNKHIVGSPEFSQQMEKNRAQRLNLYRESGLYVKPFLHVCDAWNGDEAERTKIDWLSTIGVDFSPVLLVLNERREALLEQGVFDPAMRTGPLDGGLGSLTGKVAAYANDKTAILKNHQRGTKHLQLQRIDRFESEFCIEHAPARWVEPELVSPETQLSKGSVVRRADGAPFVVAELAGDDYLLKKALADNQESLKIALGDGGFVFHFEKWDESLGQVIPDNELLILLVDGVDKEPSEEDVFQMALNKLKGRFEVNVNDIAYLEQALGDHKHLLTREDGVHVAHLAADQLLTSAPEHIVKRRISDARKWLRNSEGKPPAEIAFNKERYDRLVSEWSRRADTGELTTAEAFSRELLFSSPEESLPVIDDVGEKFGGARKDLAISGKSTSNKDRKEGVPAWRKSFKIFLDANDGLYKIQRVKGAGRKFIREHFSSAEEAEEYLPKVYVRDKHVVRKIRDSDPEQYAIYRKPTEKKSFLILGGFVSLDEAQDYLDQNAVEIINTVTKFDNRIHPRLDFNCFGRLFVSLAVRDKRLHVETKAG